MSKPNRPNRSPARTSAPPRPPRPPDARRVALEALVRIDAQGAYANLVLGPLLDHSGLEERDRHFVTELVYGTTRMRRACDWLVDRHVRRDLDADVRAATRLGAYQLAFAGVAPHAAVDTTVRAAPPRARGLVNAVLRKVAADVADGVAHVAWPDDATRLSYPDWVVTRLEADLGAADAHAALAAMNLAASPEVRADGYVQDRASQWLTDAIGIRVGDVVVDLCAAPGGKTTAMAADGARVLAADVRPGRVALVADNVARTGAHHVLPVVADGRRPPVRPGSADVVLVDAPCSGLGVLHRRADARWRVDAEAPERLAALQRALLDAAVDLVKPGGLLAYSVCTLTGAETEGIDAHLAAAHPGLEALDPPDAPWRTRGRGAQLLPQDAGTDGMFLLVLRVPARTG